MMNGSAMHAPATGSYPVRGAEQVKRDLKASLDEMGLAVTREFVTESGWGLWFRSGDFPLLVENILPARYCTVAFQITFRDDATIRAVSDIYARQDYRFIYRLTRALTTPRNSFVRRTEGTLVTGFTVLAYIYPFHTGFSIRHLDGAVQAVVSAGDLGIAYLRSELGPVVLDHTPLSPVPEPEAMFE